MKEPKYYFYDTGQVAGDESRKLENAVACALKKELDYREDVLGKTCSLCYIQNKQGLELDFVISQEEEITHCLEVKLSDSNLSKSFAMLKDNFPDAHKIQIVKNITKTRTYRTGEEIHKAADFLYAVILFPVGAPEAAGLEADGVGCYRFVKRIRY